MVATRPRAALSIMTPGINSMLRARRKDKDIRPNRFLDRMGSRGMLYENEELRLRTISFNADLEKGQQYIKKLRRENTQLRREIWNLRDQYDKLESMIRSQDQEQIFGQEADRYNCNCGVDEADDCGMLSSVPEESENEDSNAADESAENIEKSDQSSNLEPYDDQLRDMTKQFGGLSPTATETVTLATPTQNHVTQQLTAYDEDGTAEEDDEYKMCSLKVCEEFVKVFRKNADEQRTFVFSTDGFDNLTAQEIIDHLEQHFKDDCHNVIDGVRFTNRHCFLCVKDVERFRKLIETGLSVRGKSVQPDALWERSSVLQLSAVPQDVTDEQIVAVTSRFADVIGNVERQTYKGFDTGERFVHIVTSDIIPCQLLLGSTCLPVKIIHPRRKSSSIARRKSFRSQISINLKTPDRDTDENSPKPTDTPQTTPQESGTHGLNASKQEPSSSSSKSANLVSSATDVETNVFQFPRPANVRQTVSKKKQESPPPQQQNTMPSANGSSKDAKNSTVNESPSVFRRFAQRSMGSFRRHNINCENSRPPSPGVFPGTPRIIRRSSVNFRNGSGPRGVDLYSNELGSSYMRERSASDASSRFSICRRKLSVTGHENSTKIPWCGCWGIGCC